MLLLAASLHGGCVDPIECGDGTIERDGTCVAADVSKEPASCGHGTYFDPESQTCVSDFEPVVCDPGTTEEVTVDGVTTCVGVGGADDCTRPLVCPNAAAGKVTVCGRILDVQTAQPVQLDGTSTGTCNLQAPAASGPCSLGLQLYDAAIFASEPQNAQPLPYEELHLDECGRFRVKNANPPTVFPLLGVALDDHPATGNQNYVVSGVALGATAGQRIDGVTIYAVRTATDAMWTESAGEPFGAMTFGQHGMYLGIFKRGNSRLAGVQITAGDMPDAQNSYYFSDGNASIISTVGPELESTGNNGAALMATMGVPVMYSGTGAEQPECVWPEFLGAAIPGVILTQEFVMKQSASEAPCL